MSLSGGQGAANDATVQVAQPEMPPEVAAYMQAMQERALEQYERNHRTPGTREYDAHVAQLRRLRDEAAAAVASAATAHKRAQEHEDSALREHRSATDRLDAAELALDDFLRGAE